MSVPYHTVALFGEAEKGDFQTAYFCQNLRELEEYLGEPPPNTLGLYFAVQALLFQHNLLFFRVREEGFSYQDYVLGLNLLKSHEAIVHVGAVFLPGVGDPRIIEAMTPFCIEHQTILVTREADLYDYLTSSK